MMDLTEDQLFAIGICSSVLTLLLAIFAILGNGLVLYASHGNKNLLRLAAQQDLDIVIKSLALTDLIIGLFGIPSRILAFHSCQTDEKLDVFACKLLNIEKIILMQRI